MKILGYRKVSMYVWVMQREDGFYWVFIYDSWNECKKWIILEWVTDEWYRIGVQDSLDSEDIKKILKINETRLEPPIQ